MLKMLKKKLFIVHVHALTVISLIPVDCLMLIKIITFIIIVFFNYCIIRYFVAYLIILQVTKRKSKY